MIGSAKSRWKTRISVRAVQAASDSIVPALRFLLTLTAALSGAILAVRAITGPFHFLVSVRSPLSAETICAISLIGLILSGMDGQSRYAPAGPRWPSKHLGIALVLVAAAFHGVTRLYFFGDDFFVVRDAVDLERGREFLRSLVHSKGEIYYRPAGYFLLWLSSLPLGLDPAKWHLLNLLLHLTDCALLYGVSLRLGFLPSTALLAALLFGIHGSRCEAVVWIGGYFELLSLFFVLATLLLYLRWRQSGDRWARMGAVCSFVLGMWSKESAYALPLLLFILPWHEKETWSRRIRSVAPFFVAAGLAFIHRWLIIGGIGGYADPASGRSEAATINLFRIGKLLAARLWAILIFPIDWDVKPGLLLAAAMITMMVAMLYASRLRYHRQRR